MECREVGREVDPVGRQRPLQIPSAGRRNREDALGGIAVELHVDRGERDRAAEHIGLRLQGKTTEAAAGQGRLARRASRGRPARLTRHDD